MACSVLQLLVILLVVSHLLSSNAVPLARTRRLLSNSQVLRALKTNHQGITEEAWEEEFINGRMDLEKMDYSGTGPNNRHIPPPSGGKS